jgi:hypothetical protein
MFDFEDIENISKQRELLGISDESEFGYIVQSVLNILRSYKNYDQIESEIVSMKIINVACDYDGKLNEDRTVSTILALLQHIFSLSKAISEIEELSIESYYNNFQINIVNPLIENPNTPYYGE